MSCRTEIEKFFKDPIQKSLIFYLLLVFVLEAINNQSLAQCRLNQFCFNRCQVIKMIFAESF